MQWTIEMGAHGGTCRVFCDGTQVYPEFVDIHLAVGEASRMTLRFAEYLPERCRTHEPGVHVVEDPILTAHGKPFEVFLEIGDRTYRALPMSSQRMGVERGLFGEQIGSNET